MKQATNKKYRLPPLIESNIAAIMDLKHGPGQKLGWSPRLRQRYGYYTPDEVYEASVAGFVQSDTCWLDVGCGRQTFPSNPLAAAMLARRCRLLAGLDPSENIIDNPLLHERARCTIEDYRTDRLYDLVTMRMVAEHIENPASTVAALGRLVAPNGHVIVYTVPKWSVAAVAAAITPMAVHHYAKRVLWGGEERDTFPTFYRMNTHRVLRGLFETNGFSEQLFLWLGDTRAFGRWQTLAACELQLWRWLHAMRIPYPEACIIGIYRKNP
jgi:SAM-dependent methyltransferase